MANDAPLGSSPFFENEPHYSTFRSILRLRLLVMHEEHVRGKNCKICTLRLVFLGLRLLPSTALEIVTKWSFNPNVLGFETQRPKELFCFDLNRCIIPSS